MAVIVTGSRERPTRAEGSFSISFLSALCGGDLVPDKKSQMARFFIFPRQYMLTKRANLLVGLKVSERMKLNIFGLISAVVASCCCIGLILVISLSGLPALDILGRVAPWAIILAGCICGTVYFAKTIQWEVEK